MAQVQMIRLADIRRDAKARTTQVRVTTNPETVAQYADDLRAGDEFPAVSLVADGKGRFLIADGWHRVEAYAEVGRTVIPAKILECFERHSALDSATRHAMQANLKHGLRLTQGDQRKKAEAALLLPLMQPLGDRKIAREIGTSPQTISRARANLVRERLIPHPITGERFNEFCPLDYAGQQAFNDAFPGGADQFKKTCGYVRKLSAHDPSNWRIAEEAEGNVEEGAIIHSGLLRGKVVSFFPFDNPIVDGLPKRFAEAEASEYEDNDKRQRKITKGDREEWERRGITKEIAAAEMRLLKTGGPDAQLAMRLLTNLWDHPDLRDDLRTVFGGRVSPSDGVNPLEEDF